MIGLLVSIIIIGIRVYVMKKKAVLRDMEIVQMEKDEIEMQMNLKKEQAKRIELEKYEALLEVHFKDMEIEGKESELEELKHNKQMLDKQIESYGNKLTLRFIVWYPYSNEYNWFKMETMPDRCSARFSQTSQ
ncbi:hypothetical protein [Dysgonomonas sp. 521]|uniref:hypothetical protein n=1 Tax=Dysgonomonas sp. 521 TaxID=2302932 RepID=UPI00351AE368